MSDLAQQAWRILAEVRTRQPLIHHITNFVTMNAVANITLGAGALPVMAHALEEVEEMVDSADALVLNLGTLWPDPVAAMLLAGHRANQKGIPVVLDPVGVGATRLRTDSAQRLLRELSITAVRGNAAEMATLAGFRAKIIGVEAVDTCGNASEVATAFARRHNCVAAVTGPIDVVTGSKRLLQVTNGDAIMRTVTGTGCMATAVIASYMAVERDSTLAVAAALATYGLAGEIAAERAMGPGTFQTHLFDTLAGLTEDEVRGGARIQENNP